MYSRFRGNRFLASRRRQNCTTAGQREILFQGEGTVQTDSRLALSASVASAPASTWLAARDSRRARWRLMFLASALCPQLIPGLSVFHDSLDGVLDPLAISDLSSRLLLRSRFACASLFSRLLLKPLLRAPQTTSQNGSASISVMEFQRADHGGYGLVRGSSLLEGSAWTKSAALAAASTIPSTTGPHSRSPRSPAGTASIRQRRQRSRRPRARLPP